MFFFSIWFPKSRILQTQSLKSRKCLPWTSKSANFSTKMNANELQNFQKKVIWNLPGKNTRLSLLSGQFRENVEGQKYEKTWEGSSKSSFAELQTRPSRRRDSGAIWIENCTKFRLDQEQVYCGVWNCSIWRQSFCKWKVRVQMPLGVDYFS